ncbi:MAG: hypothetical protein K5770_18010 [Lachnospiraceae bacterium]|nr:hypothetical protein [Lachnospiraceae bacterium]
MAKKWDEKLADASVKLEELSKKASAASEEAKAAKELKEEAIKDKISTAKGNVAAFQDKVERAKEENRSKLSSSLIKAQMTIEAKIAEKKAARDQKHFEAYIEDQIDYIYDCFDLASYLVANAELAILETLAAVEEFDAKYPEAE